MEEKQQNTQITVNPTSVNFEDVKSMDNGEFRQWVFLTLSDMKGSTDKIEGRQFMILTGVILSIIIPIAAIFLQDIIG